MSDRQQIITFLDELRIPFRWLDHPPVHRVVDSAKVIPDKTPVKSLLLQEKTGEFRKYLVIMSGNERLNLSALSDMLDSKKLRFASSEVLMDSMGVAPGSVSLFGLLHEGSRDISIVIDQQLLDSKELGFHPNDNTASVFIPGAAIEQIIKHTGHTHKTMKLY